MIRLIYTLLLFLIQPLIWGRLLLRSLKNPAYRHRWDERYGFYYRHTIIPDGILIHAVSVGETIAAAPLINELNARYPNLPITVTTMTPTGSDRVKALFGDQVQHVYLPYDLPCSTWALLKRFRPKLVIIMETELWPNLIAQLHRRHIPLIIANARLSDRSTHRYRRFGRATQTMLSQISLIAAQNQHSADNFLSLGLPRERLAVTGSLKFDIELTPELQKKAAHLRQIWADNRIVWIGASTYEQEDTILLSTHKKLLKQHPTLLLILVPRHPERFSPARKLIESQGFRYASCSRQQTVSADTQVILGDTLGDLVTFFGAADIAFIGGSLIARGGHNPLQAALYQLPILMGKYTFNFPVICDQLTQAGGLITVDETSLFSTVDHLIRHPEYRHAVGQEAANVLKQNQGALPQLLQLIDRYLST